MVEREACIAGRRLFRHTSFTSTVTSWKSQREQLTMQRIKHRNEYCRTYSFPMQAEPLGDGHLRAGIKIRLC